MHPEIARSGTIIDIQSITRAFGAKKAVDDLSLRVEAGQVYGLVGPNGSGKTTLTKMLCGLVKPTSGTAFVMGHDIRVAPDKIRQTVGYMSQQFSLYNDLTAQENIEFFAEVHGLYGATMRNRIDEIVSMLGLGPYMKLMAAALSGGWRQRLALATTILHAPPLMFLDEPTAGVDPVARRELWDLLFDLAAAGSNIFMTTQYMDEAERCNQVGYIYLSKLIVTGTPADLKARTVASVAGARFLAFDSNTSPATAKWLRDQPFCRGATVFGAAIHAVVSNDVGDDHVRRAAVRAGFSISGIRTIEPTLEDVFVTLTKQLQAANKAAEKKD